MIDARRRLRGLQEEAGVVGRNGLADGDGGCGGWAEGVFKDEGSGFGLGEGERNQEKKKGGHLIWVRQQTLRIGTLCGARGSVLPPVFICIFVHAPWVFLLGRFSFSTRQKKNYFTII